jgi:hypothetical protein
MGNPNCFATLFPNLNKSSLKHNYILLSMMTRIAAQKIFESPQVAHGWSRLL